MKPSWDSARSTFTCLRPTIWTCSGYGAEHYSFAVTDQVLALSFQLRPLRARNVGGRPPSSKPASPGGLISTSRRPEVLEKAAYVIMIVTAVVLAHTNVTGRHSGPPADSGLPPTVPVGDRVPALMLYAEAGDSVAAVQPEEETLLVFFSTRCVYCIASLPTYRKLARTRC